MTTLKGTIYLINPPIFEDVTISRLGRCVTRTKAEYLYPPTELLYIAYYLRTRGFSVQVIDGALRKDINEIHDQIKEGIGQPLYFIPKRSDKWKENIDKVLSK